MLTALARCCSAALTPTFLGSTTMAMSRRPPALRAVTVPPSPEPAVIATPIGISVGPAPPTGSGATGRAGWGRGAGAGFPAGGAAGDDGFAGAGFVPGFDDGSGTGRLPGWDMVTVPAHLTGHSVRGASS